MTEVNHTMSERNAAIIRARGDGTSVAELAKHHGISPERVRQIVRLNEDRVTGRVYTQSIHRA